MSNEKHPLIEIVIAAVATGGVVFGVVNYFSEQKSYLLNSKIDELKIKLNTQPESKLEIERLNIIFSKCTNEKNSLQVKNSMLSSRNSICEEQLAKVKKELAEKHSCEKNQCVKGNGQCGDVHIWAGATADKQSHGYDVRVSKPAQNTIHYSSSTVPNGFYVGTMWSCK